MEKQNYNINESEQIKNNQSEQIEENQSESNRILQSMWETNNKTL